MLGTLVVAAAGAVVGGVTVLSVASVVGKLGGMVALVDVVVVVAMVVVVVVVVIVVVFVEVAVVVGAVVVTVLLVGTEVVLGRTHVSGRPRGTDPPRIRYLQPPAAADVVPAFRKPLAPIEARCLVAALLRAVVLVPVTFAMRSPCSFRRMGSKQRCHSRGLAQVWRWRVLWS